VDGLQKVMWWLLAEVDGLQKLMVTTGMVSLSRLGEFICKGKHSAGGRQVSVASCRWVTSKIGV